MTFPQQTFSAALFHNSQPKFVPLDWFERAVDNIAARNLSPILFTAGGKDFLLDDCYALADPGHDIVRWGETIPACRQSLVQALKERTIEHLRLDCPRPDAQDRSHWRLVMSASASNIRRACFFGIDAGLMTHCRQVLEQAFVMASDLFDIRYGFAYTMPLADEPDCYAIGTSRTTFGDLRRLLRRDSAAVDSAKTPDQLWRDEVNGQQRYINGLFRQAYPANLLSNEHIERAGLKFARIGRLTEIDAGRWLWELAPEEISEANEMLTAKRALVSQILN